MLPVDQENVPPIFGLGNAPQTPKKGTKRSAFASLPLNAPKRVFRTYKQHDPHAVSSSVPDYDVVHSLLDEIESLDIDSGTRDRIIGMHKHSAAQPARSARRSIFSRAGSNRPRRMRPGSILQHIAQPLSSISIENMRQLRVALASESPAWLHDFLQAGGYETLLAHLDSLLRMEWREEQHDDTLLFEILRCMVALASSQTGRRALLHYAPMPFEHLCVAMFEGNIPKEPETRRLIAVLLHTLAQEQLDSDVLARRTMHKVRVEDAACVAQAPDKRHGAILAAMLLHTPSPPSIHNTVDFLQNVHEHRPLRCYVEEFDRVCHDFFWIFCHEHNQVWDWDNMDQRAAFAPRVPSGMTGSVEWEAITYLTTHLCLLNTILSFFVQNHPPGARAFVSELTKSNFPRVLNILRKASQTYYSALHAELAHWHSLSDQVRYADLANMRPSTSKPKRTPSTESKTSVRNTSIYYTPLMPSDPWLPRQFVSNIRHVSTESESFRTSPSISDEPHHVHSDVAHQLSILGDVEIAHVGF